MDAAEMAARIYLIRSRRRSLPLWLQAEWLEDETIRRRSVPYGRFDAAGCFWPDDVVERRSCCSKVQEPSRREPWTLLRHCYTLQHCAALVGAKEAEVRARVRALRHALELAGRSIRG
jgi:hypothetical protein